MSNLIDLVLEQRLILASALLALLPLVLAVLIVLLGRLRALLRTLRELRREIRQRKAEQQADDSAFQRPEDMPAVFQAIAEVEQEPEEADADTDESGDEAEADDGEAEEVSSQMQDLLDSVFTGEERANRYADLLEGLEPVDIHDLAAMSEAIARRLKAG